MLGHFKKAGVPPKRIVKEFPVTPDAHVPVGASPSRFVLIVLSNKYRVGTTLSAAHFVPGQFVDVVANSWVHSVTIPRLD
jgi:large subunit ribosomal protein L3